MFDWPPGLLHTQRGFRDYQQGAKPSFQHLSCGDALFHAPELSRLRNACRARAELSSIARMHSVARGSCPQILLRDPNRHACDGAIKQFAAAGSIRKRRSTNLLQSTVLSLAKPNVEQSN